jgi:hypothetical protein
MTHATVEQLVDVLATTLREPSQRNECIAKFQAIVWQGLDPGLPTDVRDILCDLAYDLDFFEPQPDIRSQDRALYGQERMETEIRKALEKLNAAGVRTPDRRI